MCDCVKHTTDRDAHGRVTDSHRDPLHRVTHNTAIVLS